MTANRFAERPADILLVEDNKADVVLTRECFKRTGAVATLHHVENGAECMSFLRKEGAYRDAPTPDLILLDINMPVMDGQEVLEKLIADDRLSHLPVVVLTTSSSDGDLLRMYQLRCSSYVVKPVDFDDFMRVVEDLQRYWSSTVMLPPCAPVH